MNINIKYIWVKDYPRPTSINYHYHNYHEIVYYQQASGHSFYCTGKSIKMPEKSPEQCIIYRQADDINMPKSTLDFNDASYVYFAPGDLHNEINNQPTKLVAIGFELDATFPFDLQTSVFQDDQKVIGDLIVKIVNEYQTKRNLYMWSIENYISRIVVEILREKKIGSQLETPLSSAIHYMQDYFASRIDYDNLARLSGYCPEHFRYLFKKEMGVSPKEFILNKRFDYAKNLLENTNLPLYEIASSCGFSDFPQFSVFIKKRTGFSPRDYRKSKSTIN
jgi:AraC-like DNA-binding protein